MAFDARKRDGHPSIAEHEDVLGTPDERRYGDFGGSGEVDGVKGGFVGVGDVGNDAPVAAGRPLGKGNRGARARVPEAGGATRMEAGTPLADCRWQGCSRHRRLRGACTGRGSEERAAGHPPENRGSNVSHVVVGVRSTRFVSSELVFAGDTRSPIEDLGVGRLCPPNRSNKSDEGKSTEVGVRATPAERVGNFDAGGKLSQ